MFTAVKNVIFFLVLLISYIVYTRWNRLIQAVSTSSNDLCSEQMYSFETLDLAYTSGIR